MKKRYLIAVIVFLVLAVCNITTVLGSTPVYNTGLEFDGNAAYGGIPTHVLLPNTFADVPNTFEAWVRVPVDVPDDFRVGNIIGSFPDGNRAGSMNTSFQFRETGYPRFWWNDGEQNVNAMDYDIRTGEWVHYAGVRDESVRRGTITLYINGEVLYEWLLGAGTAIIPRDPPIIGGDYRSLTFPPGSDSCFIGRIGEVRVWNTERTQEEIQANMNIELTGDEEGLLGYWKFDEGEGEILHDSSPYENHGTIIGAEWYTE